MFSRTDKRNGRRYRLELFRASGKAQAKEDSRFQVKITWFADTSGLLCACVESYVPRKVPFCGARKLREGKVSARLR